MLPFISKKSKIRLRVLTWYQIIGGILGILVTIWIAAKLEQIRWVILLVVLFAMCLYVFSIYAGRLLLTDKYLTGLKLSIINQAMQILQFAVMGYAFLYASGLMLAIGITTSEGFTFTCNFELASMWKISIATSEREFSLAINLVAIYFLYFTEKLQTTIKREKVIYEEQQFAQLNVPTSNDEYPTPTEQA
ncbi:MAG: hypothetical protein JWP37_760 [Mucilaginibacter sp.]|nr:hypothetical protein [Mucilaginibacter sp.]